MTDHNSLLPLSFSNTTASGLLQHRSNGLAIVEGLLMLGGLALMDFNGVLPFAAWPVHPFFFAVILLSAQYGVQGGILAAVVATVLSHLDGFPIRPIDMAYIDYFRLVWSDSFSWILAALMVGVVTSHRSRVLRGQATTLRKAIEAENLISRQYQVLAQRTHQLERTLAGRADVTTSRKSMPLIERPKRVHQAQER